MSCFCYLAFGVCWLVAFGGFGGSWLLIPGSSQKTAIARVVPRHRLNPLHPNFNVVGSGSVPAAFRKNSHSGRYMSGDQSATLSWGDAGDSRILFIPDLMAVFLKNPVASRQSQDLPSFSQVSSEN